MEVMKYRWTAGDGAVAAAVAAPVMVRFSTDR